jgi:hypothetical protein
MSIEGVQAPAHLRGHVLPRSSRVMAEGWVQAVALVGIFGFTVLGFMAARTYQADPPVPDRVVSPTGEQLFTSEDVRHRGSHQDALDDRDLLLFTDVTPAPEPPTPEPVGAH